MSNQAWVTLATNDSYALGALVLAYSLRRVSSSRPVVVLITPSVTDNMRARLSAVFAEVVVVDVLDSRDAAHLALLARPELGITFTKIHCWSLTQYDKCVFLDADTLVVQNCDELFEREELSAAPDVGWPDCFNSGVFVYRPSAETFNNLLEFARERGSFDGGDQGLLNSYFSNWAHSDISKHLPFLYNVTSAAFYSYLPALKQYGQGLKIIHFIGNAKPWLQNFNWESRAVDAPGHLEPTLQLWWDLFVAHVHPHLDTTMAGLAGTLSRLTLGAVAPQQAALDEHTRRQGWEAGNIDYLGADSFANIWAKISATLAQAPAPIPVPEEPAAPAEPEVAASPAPVETPILAPAPKADAAPGPIETPVPAPAPEAAVAPAPVETPVPVSAAPAPVEATVPEATVAPIETAVPASIERPTFAAALAAAPPPTAAPVKPSVPSAAEPTTPVPVEASVKVPAPIETKAPAPASVEAAAAPTPVPAKPAAATAQAEPAVAPAPSPKTESPAPASTASSKAPVTPPATSAAGATPSKGAALLSSSDSPPLVSTPVKDAESPKSAEEGTSGSTAGDGPPRADTRKAPPRDKLYCQLKPSAEPAPLLTPDSELEDAAALAQSIIASELGAAPPTPRVLSATPPAPPAPTPAALDAKRLSVDEPELPTPPVSLAQIGILPSGPEPSPLQKQPRPPQTPETKKAEAIPAKVSAKQKVAPVKSSDDKLAKEASAPSSKPQAAAEPVAVESKASPPAPAPGGKKEAATKSVQKEVAPPLAAKKTESAATPAAAVPSQPAAAEAPKEEASAEPKPDAPVEPRKKKVVKKIVKKDSSESESGSPASPTGSAPVPPPRKKEKKPAEKK